MKKCIVTIARQYGSGGREVGQKLAELMGCKFYDKDLITLAAQKSGLSQDALHHVDEKAAKELINETKGYEAIFIKKDNSVSVTDGLKLKKNRVVYK